MNISKLEQIFEERFGYYGKVFDETTLPEPIKFLYEIPIYYLNSAFAPAKRSSGEFHFLARYVVNGAFNSSACDTEDGGMVCLHASVPILLFISCVNYATRCDIGTALPTEQDGRLLVYEKKIILQNSLQKADINHAKLTEYFDDFCTSLIPLDINDEIFQYGLFLYEIAIRFVAMHECMHIVLGHTAYVKKHLGINMLTEFSDQREQQFQQEFGQALEFIADLNTASGILCQTLNGNTFHPYGNQAPKFIKVDFSIFLTRSVVQAFCILLHHFPYKLENGLDEILLKTHPHPYIRMQWLNTEMGRQITKDQFTERIVALPDFVG